MKTMKIKSGSSGMCTLAHPGAPVGPTPSGAHITEVTDIPDGTSAPEVLRLFDGTINLTWVDQKDPDGGRWSLRFDELGIGRIVR